jgi:transcriptional regulator with GAF, ATPase, and Fis domain
MRHPHLTDEEVRALLEQHRTFRAAGRAAGYTGAASFRNRARRIGLSSPIAQHRVSDEDFRHAVAAYHTAPEIAKALGISRTQVRYRANQLGIVLEHAPFGRRARSCASPPPPLAICSPLRHRWTADAIAAAMEKAQWRPAAAARALGISKQRIHQLLKKFGIIPPKEST